MNTWADVAKNERISPMRKDEITVDGFAKITGRSESSADKMLRRMVRSGAATSRYVIHNGHRTAAYRLTDNRRTVTAKTRA